MSLVKLFKATEPAPPATPPARPQAPVTEEQAKELKLKLEEALQEIYQTRTQLDEYLSQLDVSQLEIQEARLKASLALIDNFLATGEWDPSFGAPAGGAPAAPAGEGAGDEAPTNTFQPGWNGTFVTGEEAADRALFSDGNYMGTVYLQLPSDPNARGQLGFQLDENAVDLKVYNHGRDLIFRQTLADGTVQYWVAKNMVTDIQTPIAIDASRVKRLAENKKLNVDLSGAYRISDDPDTFGQEPVQAFLVLGSQGSDILTGSQNVDKMLGLGGDDSIDGGAGNDELYGDNDATSAAMYGVSAGNDVILGGAGNDTGDGGGGINTGFETDVSDTGTIRNLQRTAPRAGQADLGNNWYRGSGWRIEAGAGAHSEGNFSSHRTTPEALTLTLPEGFDMAYAETDADVNGIKITLVGRDAAGLPITKTIRIRDFFDINNPAHLIVKGNDANNIIDFHKISNDMQNSIIEIQGGGGNDMLLGAKNILTRDGLNPATMFTSSQNVAGQTGLIHDTTEGEVLQTTGSNADEIRVRKPNGTIENGDMAIEAPVGYDNAYYIRDGNDVVVVLVDPASGGVPAKRIVVRIQNVAEGFIPTIAHPAEEVASGDAEASSEDNLGATLSPILLPGELNDFERTGLNAMDGGAGSDFLFGSASDVMTRDGGDSVVIGNYAGEQQPPADDPPADDPPAEDPPADDPPAE